MATAAIQIGSNRVKRTSRKVRRADEVTRIARVLLPAAQAERGGFKVVDVVSHTEEGWRHTVRTGEKRTIRRRTHIEKIATILGLDAHEAAACQWYVDAHSARYHTLNVIACYGDSTRSGKTSFDHLPATAEQDLAADLYDTGRDAISAPLRNMFERVVISEWPVTGNIEPLFRMALNQLLNRIEGLTPLGE